MATNNQPPGPPGQNFTICLPDASVQKKYSILKFTTSHKVDFTSCPGGAKLERENNFREFKSAYDVDVMPKSGAGSEFGREQREEARKKKYGVRIKKYNAQEQPWLLKLGNGKQVKRFKGTRSGGISENASYYVFMPLSETKFVAQPVEEWHEFNPIAKYKSLNAEEAEEEFSRRGKTLNHFAIMLKKRITGTENDDLDPDEGGKSGKKSKKSRSSLLVSEFDEMDNDDDDDDDDDSEADVKDADEEVKTKKPKQKKKAEKEKDTDDEAVEEDDEVDEGQEVDYMSGSSSDDEGMYDDSKRDESETYNDGSVVEEEGLKKLNNSDDEDEEDDDKKDEDNEDEEEGKSKEDKNKDQDSDSDISSDSDIDSDSEIPILDKKSSGADKKPSPDLADGTSGSRPTTPAADLASSSKKRKGESHSSASSSKKIKTEAMFSGSSANPAAGSSTSHVGDGSMEDVVRRYLIRKPMTTKDILQKVTSKYSATMSKEQIMNSIGVILKRLNPERQKINNKLLLSIKKTN